MENKKTISSGWDIPMKIGTTISAEKGKPVKVSQPESQPQVIFTDKEMEKWLFPNQEEKPKNLFCCMFYGADGTGKSGIVQSYPLKGDERLIIIDLDGGNEPLLQAYNEDKQRNIFIVNPLIMRKLNGQTIIDYAETINRIRGAIEYIGRNIKEKNIKAVCIDGLSKLLKNAEYQMRIERHLTPDGGVDYRYWKIRNQMFLEVLEQLKSLPIDTFYVAHDDFIDDGDVKIAAVKAETNRMMWQKVRCIREVKKDIVEYKVIIDKSKYNVAAEGAEISFLTINKTTKEVKWDASKIYERLKK